MKLSNSQAILALTGLGIVSALGGYWGLTSIWPLPENFVMSGIIPVGLGGGVLGLTLGIELTKGK